METFEIKYFVLILPMSLFYLAMLLKFTTYFIEKRFVGGKEAVLKTIPSGKELSLMSMSLDIAILIKNIAALQSFTEYAGIPVNTLVPGLLFVIHLLMYIISSFFETKIEDRQYFLTGTLGGMGLGLIAIFSNSWTIELIIAR
jgi:hypothetical protein